VVPKAPLAVRTGKANFEKTKGVPNRITNRKMFDTEKKELTESNF
jgi:hypothetical protein